MDKTTRTAELEDMKRQINILDLANRLGLQIRGRQARCFNSGNHKHNDRNFSLGLDTKENRYKCFTCNEGGSVIDLYMAVKKVEFKEALEELKHLYGIHSYGNAYPPQRPPEKPQVYKHTDNGVYKRIMELGGIGKETKEYLKRRGINEETIARFKLFCIQDYKTVSSTLKREFTLDKLRQAGVIGDKDTFIFYKHKVLIPFMEGGEIVFYQGRRTDEKHPRYLLPKEIPIPLYNTNTLAGLTKGARVFICEGVFDALIMEQEGEHAVAILGVNNFKPEWVEKFKGYEVVLALDNDEAGNKATEELAKLFYLKGIKTKTIELPQGIKDITEFYLHI